MVDPVQEIKAKLSIEDVVAPYVPLKRSGKHLKACCPFHQEKTPSFYVSPERQLAYCFSCHKGGDLFQFIQDIEGLDFRGALEFLAEKAHVDLPKWNSSQRKVSKDFKDRLKAVCEDASKFFVQELWGKGEAEKVMDYLKQRGLDEKTIREFSIGFAPEGKDALYRFLLEKKHEKSDILQSTLALARDSEAADVTDRFKLRLMVPIENIQGDIVAFGGRALKKGDQPKYLNSAEYALYNKSGLLYNLSKAKNAIREADFVVVVEGYFDVLASWQAGVHPVVATCGTALTEEQIKLVRRYTRKIAFAFDSDKAGEAALLRAVESAQHLQMEIFVVSIEGGKDAADLVKQDSDLWRKAVQNKKPYLEHFLAQDQERFDLSESQGKRDFSDAFLNILKGVIHPVERDHYLKKLASLVGTPVSMLYDYLHQLQTKRFTRSLKERRDSVSKLSKRDRLTQYFLGLVLAFPDICFKRFTELQNFDGFTKRAHALGLVKPLHQLNAEHYEQFYSELSSETSVYKDIQGYYNAQGMVDDSFYASLENGNELKKWALVAEIKNTDLNKVSEEFEKLITLLYFDSLSKR